MKTILSMVLISLLVGCASQGVQNTPAATQYYKFPGDDADSKISGLLVTPYEVDKFNGVVKWKRRLEVSINDQQIINDYLGSQASGELSGKYGEKRIVSLCSATYTNPNDKMNQTIDCIIMVDNQRTVTLRF